MGRPVRVTVPGTGRSGHVDQPPGDRVSAGPQSHRHLGLLPRAHLGRHFRRLETGRLDRQDHGPGRKCGSTETALRVGGRAGGRTTDDHQGAIDWYGRGLLSAVRVLTRTLRQGGALGQHRAGHVPLPGSLAGPLDHLHPGDDARSRQIEGLAHAQQHIVRRQRRAVRERHRAQRQVQAGAGGKASAAAQGQSHRDRVLIAVVPARTLHRPTTLPGQEGGKGVVGVGRDHRQVVLGGRAQPQPRQGSAQPASSPAAARSRCRAMP